MNMDKELERIKKNLKFYKAFLILIDIVALILLFFQIKLDDVSYYSYILLIICNLIIFLIKPSVYLKINRK